MNKNDKNFGKLHIDTADYTLDRWEKEYGIEVNSSKDIDFRKSVIKSKMRGTGTVTIKLIKEVAESYVNGGVDIVEHNDEFYFIVKFIGVKGIPPNLEDLKEEIENIKPAHLGVLYTFIYLTWDQYEVYNMTCAEWDILNLTCDEFQTYSGGGA